MCLLATATVEDCLHWSLAMQTHKRRLELTLACMRLTNYGHRWLVDPEYISLQRCPHKPVSRSPEEFDVEYQTVPSATTAFTASLISALSFLQMSALPKLYNVRGAEINSLCRHDSYRP